MQPDSEVKHPSPISDAYASDNKATTKVEIVLVAAGSDQVHSIRALTQRRSVLEAVRPPSSVAQKYTRCWRVETVTCARLESLTGGLFRSEYFKYHALKLQKSSHRERKLHFHGI